MSAALLKRSLMIVEDDLKSNVSKPMKNKFMPYSKSANKKKTTVNDIKDKIASNKNLVNENMEKLLKLSESRNEKTNIDSKIVKKLFKRAQTNRYVLNIESTEEKEQTSIFTEEDFQNFEKEYFPTK